VCLESAVDFFRRVALPSRSYPMLLAWLVLALWDVYCELRRACVSDLLSQPAANLDRTTLKFRTLFMKELLDCRQTGCLDKVWVVPLVLKSDVRMLLPDLLGESRVSR
jgi:hypothetical protein